MTSDGYPYEAPGTPTMPLASTTANPDRTAATVAHSGLATHPVVAAMGDADTDEAKAAAVLRWLADERFDCADYTDTYTAEILRALADEVEAAGTDNTTRSPDA